MTGSRSPRAILLAFAMLLAGMAGALAAPARPGSGLGEERVVALRGLALVGRFGILSFVASRGGGRDDGHEREGR